MSKRKYIILMCGALQTNELHKMLSLLSNWSKITWDLSANIFLGEERMCPRFISNFYKKRKKILSYFTVVGKYTGVRLRQLPFLDFCSFFYHLKTSVIDIFGTTGFLFLHLTKSFYLPVFIWALGLFSKL